MNEIRISGIATSEPRLSHTVHGEEFYSFEFASERESGVDDVVNCVVSKNNLWKVQLGNAFDILGEIRTYNHERKTNLTVFVRDINDYSGTDINQVHLIGYICKKPLFRQTPLGREICDLLIASNRVTGKKSDYIPCIAWGRIAYETSKMGVGTKVSIIGRLQSRDYIKRLEDGNSEVRTTYEVSAKHISRYREEDDAGENNDGRR